MSISADYDGSLDTLYVSLVDPVPAERIHYRPVENAHVVFRYQDDKLVGITVESLRYQGDKALCGS